MNSPCQTPNWPPHPQNRNSQSEREVRCAVADVAAFPEATVRVSSGNPEKRRKVKSPHEQITKQDRHSGRRTSIQIQNWWLSVCEWDIFWQLNHVLLSVRETPTQI